MAGGAGGGSGGSSGGGGNGIGPGGGGVVISGRPGMIYDPNTGKWMMPATSSSGSPSAPVDSLSSLMQHMDPISALGLFMSRYGLQGAGGYQPGVNMFLDYQQRAAATQGAGTVMHQAEVENQLKNHMAKVAAMKAGRGIQTSAGARMGPGPQELIDRINANKDQMQPTFYDPYRSVRNAAIGAAVRILGR